MPQLVGFALVLALAGGPEPSAAARQASKILADDSYQRELPAEEAPLRPPPWFEALFRGVGWLMLGAAGVGALLLLVWIAGRLTRPRVTDAPVDGPGPAPALEVPLEDASALAAAGRFEEAIHALLLATIAALSRATRLAPSLTSREVLGKAPLGAAAREALAGLVLAVELTRFGGEVPTEADYRDCLGRFHAFLASYRGAA